MSMDTFSQPFSHEDHHFKYENIEWAQPDGQSLTLNIHVPDTAKTGNPVLIVYHGGGWRINTNEVMDSLSQYVCENGNYVVCNVNYRLLGDQNDAITMNKIVEDALGAFLWVKQNIKQYGGDPKHISLTGDSAGGHLALMVALGRKHLGQGGLDGEELTFHPTYIPNGHTTQSIMSDYDLSIKSIVPSYPVVSIDYAVEHTERKIGRGILGNSVSYKSHPHFYHRLSPYHLVLESEELGFPPTFFLVGSIDKITTPESIQQLVNLLKDKEQSPLYWEYEGMPHAFLDGKENSWSGTTTTFHRHAPRALDRMIKFLNAHN